MWRHTENCLLEYLTLNGCGSRGLPKGFPVTYVITALSKFEWF
jgi:hypothetical protein